MPLNPEASRGGTRQTRPASSTRCAGGQHAATAVGDRWIPVSAYLAKSPPEQLPGRLSREARATRRVHHRLALTLRSPRATRTIVRYPNAGNVRCVLSDDELIGSSY